MKKAKTIAIDGPDKVGKATQARMLCAALLNTGRKVCLIEVPIYDGPLHKNIYAMLKDGTALKHPEAFQALQAANRMMWEHLNADWFGMWDVIIFDRWNASSWAYGRAAGISDVLLHRLLDHILFPDLTIILDGEMMAEAEDTYEADSELRAAVRTAYKQWALEHNAPMLDANRPRDVVHSDILKHVRQELTP